MFNSKGDYYKRLVYSYMVLFIIPLIIIMLLSYLYIKPTIYKKEVDYSYNVLNHIVYSTNMVFKEIEQMAFNYSVDKDFQKVLYSDPKYDIYFISGMIDRISTVKNAYENLHSVYLYSSYNDKILSNENFYIDLSNFHDKEFIEECIADQMTVKSRTINFSDRNGDFIEGIRVISIIKYLRDRKGILIFNVYESTLREIIDSLSGENGMVLVTDEKGNVISSLSADNNLISASYIETIVKSDDKNSFTIKENKNIGFLSKEKMVSFVKSEMNNWIFINIVDTGKLKATSIQITIILFIALVFCIILGLVITFHFSRKIYSPIDILISNIKRMNLWSEVANGTNRKPLVESGDEFKYINSMIDEIAKEGINMKQRLSSSNILATERFLQKLLKGEIQKDTINYNNPEFVKLDFKGERFIVLTTELDNWGRITYHMSEKDINQSKEYIREIIRKEYERSGFNTTTVNFEQKRLTTIINYSQKTEKQDEILSSVLDNANIIKESVKEQLGFSITIGIGEAVSNIYELFKSYYQSCNAIDYKVLYGNSQIIYINDLKRGKEKNYLDMYKMEFDNEMIVKAVVEKDCSKVVQQFERTIDKLIQVGADTSYIKIRFLQYLGMILRIPYEFNIELTENTFEMDYESIMNCKNIEDMKSCIYNHALQIIKMYESENENNQTNVMVDEVKKHIIENYNDNISLELMADMVFVSKYHLSRVFKQKEGKNFNEFLNGVRIEKAKELLEISNLDIKKIARNVGYDTPNSFSRMFKNRTGLSPIVYRNRMRKALQLRNMHLPDYEEQKSVEQNTSSNLVI